VSADSDRQDRQQLYLERGRNGVVLQREFGFFPGAPTVPTSFTGNLALGSHSGGPGDYILNGVGPPIREAVPCESVEVESILCEIATNGTDTLVVTVLYNVFPGDIYVLFNTSTGQQVTPTTVTPIVGGIVATFPAESPPLDPGAWSFKIMRLANPKDCFFVKANCLVLAPVVCTLTLLTLTGDGVFPNPPLFPGDSGTVALTGTGFLSGALNVTIPAAFGGPTPFTVDVVNIIDDSNMTIDFTSVVGEDGQWGVRVELASDPTCFAEIGFIIDEGINAFAV
jgi:hypothetical protein